VAYLTLPKRRSINSISFYFTGFNWGFIYLTPFIPLSFKGEGDGNKKERLRLSWTLPNLD
jgi:hypothetical protein